jgi:hypothetical protein
LTGSSNASGSESQAAKLAVVLLLGSVLSCTSETRVSLLERVLADAATPMPDAAPPGTAGSEAGAGRDGVSADAATGSHLIHRYSFSGEGTRVVDSVGGADGVLMAGATLDGAGHAALDGLDDYVDLPNGLVSSLHDATLLTWLSWNGGACWQRVFDFGSTDMGEDRVGNATTSIFATPLRCTGAGPATLFETTTANLGSVDSDTPFPVLQNRPIAVVFDVTGGELRLYAAGSLLGTGTVAPLSLLSDVNDWLGRSQWIQDQHLRGTYDEFRIYDSALSSAELAAVEKAGPDAVIP